MVYRTKVLKDKKTFVITAQLTKPSQSIQVCIASVRSHFGSFVDSILLTVISVGKYCWCKRYQAIPPESRQQTVSGNGYSTA